MHHWYHEEHEQVYHYSLSERIALKNHNDELQIRFVRYKTINQIDIYAFKLRKMRAINQIMNSVLIWTLIIVHRKKRGQQEIWQFIEWISLKMNSGKRLKKILLLIAGLFFLGFILTPSRFAPTGKNTSNITI